MDLLVGSRHRHRICCILHVVLCYILTFTDKGGCIVTEMSELL